MQWFIKSIAFSPWFVGIYEAFREFFVEYSSLSGDDVCYVLTWVFTVAFYWLGISLIFRVISFIFRGRL